MKKVIFIVVMMMSCNFLFAQNKIKYPLSDTAFDYMIIEDITYTIFGENTPVSGVKVDVTKPEATISGFINFEKKTSILLGFNFKGGITDKNFSIYKGLNSFNTAYEFRPSIHFIPNFNSAKYIKDNPQKLLIDARMDLNDIQIKKLRDTLIIMTLIYNHHLAKFPNLIDSSIVLPSVLDTFQKQLLIAFIKKINKIDDTSLNQENLDSLISVVNKVKIENDSTSINKLNLEIVNTFIKNNNVYDDRLNINRSLNEIINVISQVNDNGGSLDVSTLNIEIVNEFQKYKKIDINKEKIKREVNIGNDIWTKKNLYWFTFSPFVRTEKLNLYYSQFENQDSSYFKQEYPFYYGVGGAFNIFSLYPKRIAHYVKVGIDFSHSNNIKTLSSFNYETRTSFYSNGNSVTEITESGIAYNSSEIKNDFLGQFSFEYYYLRLKSFFPGGYFSGNLNLSNLYKLDNVIGRENDNIKISTEAGIIFNVTNNEKEKNLVSFSMYVRFEDITDSKRTSQLTKITETDDKYWDRNLSFGLKVGVPISLPKK